MYLRILKKDIRQKKTMNIILLVFVILASMFITSSVGNLVSITSSLDVYLNEAGIKDYQIISWDEEEQKKEIEDFLDASEYVEDYVWDKAFYLSEENISFEDREYEMKNSTVMCSVDMKQQVCFDKNNEAITEILDNEIYLQQKDMTSLDVKEGEVIVIEIGDRLWRLKVKGGFKDAFLGSSMMSMSRCLVSDKVMQEMLGEINEPKTVCLFYSVNISDYEKFTSEYDSKEINIIFSCGRELIKTSYFMDMMMAAILIVVSICLIVVSMVILKFTIGFTLSEEFREIGIMKSIGIRMRKIRGLYIVKYAAISIVGGTIGYVLSIPFGNMLLEQVSGNIYMKEVKGTQLLNIIITVAVCGIIILFSYLCTGKISKFSAIEAIRSGSNGERYVKKSALSLSKFRLRPILFMSLNDILSSIRTYIVLIIVFVLGIILVIVPVNFVNTMQSDDMYDVIGVVPSDVYITSEKQAQRIMDEGSKEYVESYLGQIEGKLKNVGIEADVYMQVMTTYKLTNDDKVAKSITFINMGDIEAKDYTYCEGVAPTYENEVAVSTTIAQKLDTKVGDVIEIEIDEEKKEFIVSGMFQSVSNMGEGVRINDAIEIKSYNIGSMLATQIKYKDEPDREQRENREEIIREIFDDYKCFFGMEYADEITGGMSGSVEVVKDFIVALVIVINMMVIVLVQKAFLVKERPQIAMLKALGFRNSAIIRWQVIRVSLIMILAILMGIFLSVPIGNLVGDIVYQMLGASSASFRINAIEVYVIYPAILLGFAVVSSILTSLGVRKISSRETNDLE